MSGKNQNSKFDLPKVRVFENRPAGDELAEPIGYGEMGSSGIRGVDTEESYSIRPTKIPILFASISIYAAVAIGLGMAIWSGEVLAYAITGLGAFFIGPFMIGILVWINKSLGDLEYLHYDKTTERVILPRIPLEINAKQIVEVVYLDIHNEHQQICLVVQQDDHWLYCHVYNRGEDRRPDKTLGKILGCESTYRYYSRKEIKKILGTSLLNYSPQLPI